MNELAARSSAVSPSLLGLTRLDAGLTQAQAAERCGVTRSLYSKYELGVRPPPDDILERLTMVPAIQAPVVTAEVDGVDEPAGGDARAELRASVLQHLRAQGFKVSSAGVLGPVESDKNRIRDLHAESVSAQRARAHGSLHRHEDRFISRLARGLDVAPSKIRPKLVLIKDRRSFDGLLWRWCSLHWSIPVSSGYGRRLRFLVVDEAHNDAVMGLIGLGDPVFALRCRDAAIGWEAQWRRQRLACVMDAFVLGAVPPYTDLLGGKLMALLAGSHEVQNAFAERYGHKTTLIAQRDPDARLALITTSSALGRSSVYNRLVRSDGSLAMEPVGYTQGTGDFHFSGAIYERLAEFAAHVDPSRGSHRHQRWGTSGFRNRREVLQVSLEALGLDSRALRSHGVQRQVFLTRLASDTDDYLCGRTDHLTPRTAGVDEIADWWRRRWAVPRSGRSLSWLNAEPELWRLFGDSQD
ncbi:Druantia anti-phage system protein DruA [Mycolicibacterium sp. S3B2]|uniref:Druantia anti-phage system protein DruA n=1 Tax=Mycolicibacterium sp. S3B2 TaxID=3415120 RepID=UPI003C7E78AA